MPDHIGPMIGNQLDAPVLIFGTGGSGTRVVARIVHHAGCFLGANRNESEDSLEFGEFFDRWIDRYLAATKWLEAGRLANIPSNDELPEMCDEFEAALVRHLTAPMPLWQQARSWGWKTPRSIFLLPFLWQRFPRMRAIHLVRDGRDMAFSTNQNQLNKHGGAILTSEERARATPVQSALLWARVNVSAYRFAQSRLPDDYLQLAFEEVCTNGEAAVKTILGFLGRTVSSFEAKRIAEAEIEAPASIGRWRTQPAAAMDEIAAAVGPALTLFGYGAEPASCQAA